MEERVQGKGGGNFNLKDVFLLAKGEFLNVAYHTFLISDFKLQGLLCWLKRDFLNLSITLLFKLWCSAGGSCIK